MKSAPAPAVPEAVVQATEAAVALEPVRVSVSVPLGPASLTVSVAGEKPTVLSSSTMVTVVVLVGPSTAPPVGAESAIVKLSSPSASASFRIGSVARKEPP
ncbi:MAG: hypothetical protein IPH30_05515 [Betaproteobacteria bacterium]|nr:hypothetical protein [Betaproteobacteria bacterium]